MYNALRKFNQKILNKDFILFNMPANHESRGCWDAEQSTLCAKTKKMNNERLEVC